MPSPKINNERKTLNSVPLKILSWKNHRTPETMYLGLEDRPEGDNEPSPRRLFSPLVSWFFYDPSVKDVEESQRSDGRIMETDLEIPIAKQKALSLIPYYKKIKIKEPDPEDPRKTITMVGYELSDIPQAIMPSMRYPYIGNNKGDKLYSAQGKRPKVPGAGVITGEFNALDEKKTGFSEIIAPILSEGELKEMQNPSYSTRGEVNPFVTNDMVTKMYIRQLEEYAQGHILEAMAMDFGDMEIEIRGEKKIKKDIRFVFVHYDYYGFLKKMSSISKHSDEYEERVDEATRKSLYIVPEHFQSLKREEGAIGRQIELDERESKIKEIPKEVLNMSSEEIQEMQELLAERRRQAQAARPAPVELSQEERKRIALEKLGVKPKSE
jgi:hypothetical protein